MKKIPEDIAYQVLHEVMFAGTDKKSSDAISKLLKQGKIRRIAPKIYTTNFEANGEDIVRRNIFSILGRLYPGAILSHRTAFECMPTSSGDIFLTYKYSRKISLPGVTVHLLEGPQVDANDRPFIDGLYMSHQTRAFLENMQAFKNIGGADKCLGQQQIEEKLEKMVRVNGETALNVLRDEARETAERLGFQKEFAKLSQLISAILTTHTSSILRSPLTIARAMGEPYDAERMDLFQNAFAYLTNYEFAYRENVQWEDKAFRNFAFFESYFSNYIEGTEFTIEDARTIISTGRPMPSRRDDSHDILGTYFVAANKIEMQRIPQAAEELLQMLQARHKILLEARYIVSVQNDGNLLIFQNVTTRLIYKRQSLLSLDEQPSLINKDYTLIINTNADAYYVRDIDSLFFKRLSNIMSIFPGINELYNEATDAEVDSLFRLSMLHVNPNFTRDKVKTANRRKIKEALDMYNNYTAEQKIQLPTYLQKYCADLIYDEQEGKFEISTEKTLSLLLNGLCQRYYTTEISNEKKVALATEEV